jgi:hypothetical protein
MRNALVISPFATVPLDVGRRRRVHQTTRLLADNGYRITLLLLACEDGWRVRHQDEDFERLREQWGEVIVVYGDPKIGLPPRNGDRHHLDEWWDFNLEHTLRNILSRRFFDICLVHQVWLSRAFDLLDGCTAKILDLHDLLWRRREIFEAAGVAPERLFPDEASELFGIERADIVLTALESDAADLARRVAKKIVNLPFYDRALEAEIHPSRASRYGDPDKVIFGFLGNGDGTDATNLKLVLAALEKVVGTTAAPAEIVVAGELGERADSQIPIRRVASIASVAQLDREVDYAVAPQFVAPGLDTRLADALALGVPVLASPFGSAGVRFDPLLVCNSPEEMASRIVEISLSRPPLSKAQAAMRSARDHLRSRSAAGATKLLDAIARATEPMVIDLSAADPQADCLVLQSYLSSIRVFSSDRSILLALPPDLMPHVAPLLPLPVTPVTGEGLALALEGIVGRVMLVDVFGTAPPSKTGSELPYRVVRDLRWAPMKPNPNLDEATLALAPFFHSNVDREPAALELRRRWARENEGFLGSAPPTRFVFVDALAGPIDLAGTADRLHTRIIPLSDEASFRGAAMFLLEGAGPVQIVWLARVQGHHHRLLVQLCALRDIPLWAMLDPACFANGRLPPRTAKSFDRVCEHQLGLLSRRIG